jgi:sensor histidine kinase YesM
MKRSITKTVIILFSLLSIGFLTFFISEISLDRYQLNENKKLLNQQELSSQIYNNVHEMLLLTKGYLSFGDEQLFVEYSLLSNNLVLLIDEYKSTFEIPQARIEGYIRRLSNYNEYSRDLLDNIGNKIDYDNVTYINNGLSNQLLEVQNLIVDNHEASTENLKNVLNTVASIKLMILIIIVLFVIVVIIITIKFLRELMSSMKVIESKANALVHHQWETEDIKLRGYDEIDTLASAINEMKGEIVSYIEKVNKKNELELRLLQNEAALTTAKLNMLRAQINPHFLFNALNMIGKTALLEQPELALEMIESTSEILRYSLSVSEEMVSIEEEMKAVDSYLFIQKSRFANMVSIIEEIPVEAKTKKIPPMIIQTIVENCFKHGFNELDSFAVSIIMNVKKDELQIKIEDNGVGFDVEKFDEFNKSKIGLNNVIQQMKLRFKRDDLVQIISNSSDGCKVILHIPEKEMLR